jgi:hypothetical protein
MPTKSSSSFQAQESVNMKINRREYLLKQTLTLSKWVCDFRKMWNDTQLVQGGMLHSVDLNDELHSSIHSQERMRQSGESSLDADQITLENERELRRLRRSLKRHVPTEIKQIEMLNTTGLKNSFNQNFDDILNLSVAGEPSHRRLPLHKLKLKANSSANRKVQPVCMGSIDFESEALPSVAFPDVRQSLFDD